MVVGEMKDERMLVEQVTDQEMTGVVKMSRWLVQSYLLLL